MTSFTRASLRAVMVTRLRESGSPTPALDADVLLAHALGVRKEELYAHPERQLGAPEGELALSFLERRARGEPVAYIRGFKEFYGLRIAVDPRVLIPRPETEVLVEAVLEHVRQRLAGRSTAAAGPFDPRDAELPSAAPRAWALAARRAEPSSPAEGSVVVADIGAGSGAIAVALAVNEPRLHVIATESSPEAIEVGSANVEAHRVADRVELRLGDLLEPIAEPIDVVAANLPYLRADSVAQWTGERTSLRFEPREAVIAGEDGLDVIRGAIAQLPARLALDGAAFFECDPPQAAEVARLLGEALGGWTRTLPDLAGEARVVAAGRGAEPRAAS